MGYRLCPHCRSSNLDDATECYNCEKPMAAIPKQSIEHSTSDAAPSAPRVDLKEAAHSTAQGLVAIGLVTSFGAALGLGWDLSELDLPFFLEEISLGVLCAVTAAYLLGKFQDMPTHQITRRLLPAGAFGAIVGFCLFCIWWAFDPSAGALAIGAFAGFLSGLPIVVSFGLFGGESRPMGGLEFLNMAVGLLVGAGLGLWISLDQDDSSLFMGLLGLVGLIPALAGGRVNMWEVLSYFSEDNSSSRWH